MRRPASGWYGRTNSVKSLGRSRSAAAGGQTQDRQAEFGKGEHPFDRAETLRRAGHAEDIAACLVLTEGAGARIAHGTQAKGAIVAHPRHDHANGRVACGLRDRAEEHIAGRAMARDGRAVLQGDVAKGPLRRRSMWRLAGAMKA